MTALLLENNKSLVKLEYHMMNIYLLTDIALDYALNNQYYAQIVFYFSIISLADKTEFFVIRFYISRIEDFAQKQL